MPAEPPRIPREEESDWYKAGKEADTLIGVCAAFIIGLLIGFFSLLF